MIKYIFEGIVPTERGFNADKSVDLSVQDGGQAKIATIGDNGSSMFVRVQSWENERDPVSGEFVHSDFDKLLGKKVRVTIEVVEE